MEKKREQWFVLVLSECFIALINVFFWLELQQCKVKVENGRRGLLSCVCVKKMVKDEWEFIGNICMHYALILIVLYLGKNKILFDINNFN